MRRFVQIVLVILLLGAGGTMWYLYNKGFMQGGREWVVEQLRERGVEATFGKLTVQPFRGLVAKDVKLYESSAKKRLLARVDEMVVEANYAHAARGESFLEALTLVDASLEIPLDPKNPNGPVISVKKLNTRIHLPPKQLIVARLNAEVFGIRVNASGQLANPESARSSDLDEDKPPPHWLVRLVQEELRELRFSERAPELNVRFNGDLSKPETLVVEADLSGEKIHRADYHLESIAIAGTWQNGSLSIPRFVARDDVGRLQLSASYQSQTGAVDVRLKSGMDLPAFVRATNITDIGEFKFHTIPKLDVSARATLPGDKRPLTYQVSGNISVGPFDYGGVPLDRMNASFAVNGPRWALRDVYIRHHGGGELKLNAQQGFDENGRGDFRLGLESAINPEILMPLLRGLSKKDAELLARFNIKDAPKITLSARGQTPLDSSASGHLTFGRASYRGIAAEKGHANLRYNGRVLSVDDFVVHRPEGTGTGSLDFDFQSRLVTIKSVRAALLPLDVILWIAPDLREDLEPYRFAKDPPNVVVNGTVDMNSPPRRNRLAMKVDSHAMSYALCGKDIRLTDLKADLDFTFDNLKISNFRADCFSGSISGGGDIVLTKGKPGHTAALTISDVDFAKLTKLYFDYDESEGKLNGTYRFTGRGNDGHTMRGNGELTVTNGNVFAIPFLGPFSEILNKLVPGMGYNKANKASATFSIADGIITTPDFVVEGKGFSMIGDGRIWFLDDKIDFDMRVNARGLPGVLLFPVSKLLEYRAQSKFSETVWRPKMMPKLGR